LLAAKCKTHNVAFGCHGAHVLHSSSHAYVVDVAAPGVVSHSVECERCARWLDMDVAISRAERDAIALPILMDACVVWLVDFKRMRFTGNGQGADRMNLKDMAIGILALMQAAVFEQTAKESRHGDLLQPIVIDCFDHVVRDGLDLARDVDLVVLSAQTKMQVTVSG